MAMAVSQLHSCHQARFHLLQFPSLARQPPLPSLHVSRACRSRRPWLGLSMCAREVLMKEADPEKGLQSLQNGSLIEDHVDAPDSDVNVLDAALDDDDDDDDGAAAPTAHEVKKQLWDDAAIASAQEVYGEVSKIISSRAIDHRMFYLIEWEDGHEPSWLPASSIAKDVLAEYESPWWKASRAGEDAKLRELLADEGRDVDAVDDNGRTALLFASGLGSEKCVRILVEAGADVDGQDPDGLTPLHMATGYARQNVVSALIELGADPDIGDSKGRTPISLAQDLIDKIPKANPLQFARRLAMENILKHLESEVFETVEVEQVLDRKSTANGGIEYLVKWKDGAPDDWVSAESVADDLIKDYEAGLEYGIAEEIVEKREENGQVQYLVRWADTEEPTWEPFENVAAELVAEYEKITVAEVEKMQQKQTETQ